MWHGIEAVVPGRPLSDIGRAIEIARQEAPLRRGAGVHRAQHRRAVPRRHPGAALLRRAGQHDHAPGDDVHDRADDHARHVAAQDGVRRRLDGGHRRRQAHRPVRAHHRRHRRRRRRAHRARRRVAVWPLPATDADACHAADRLLSVTAPMRRLARHAGRRRSRATTSTGGSSVWRFPRSGRWRSSRCTSWSTRRSSGGSEHTALGGLAIAATVLLMVVSLASFLEYGVTPDVAFAHGPAAATRPAGGHGCVEPRRHPRHDGRAAVAIAAGRCAGSSAGAATCWTSRTLYLRISAVGLPFVFIALVGHGVMRGLNDLRKPLLIVVVANVVNVVHGARRRVRAGPRRRRLGVEHGARAGRRGGVVRPHPAAAHSAQPAVVGPLPPDARRRRPSRRALAGDVRRVDLVDVRRRAHRHADAGGQPGARPAVQRLGAGAGCAGDPGAVARRRRARQRRRRRGGARRRQPARACRCGAAARWRSSSRRRVRSCRTCSPTIPPSSSG